MAGRYKFNNVAISKRCQITLFAALLLTLVSCTPTLSGQLEGETGELETSQARVNITRLDASGESSKTIVVNVDTGGRFEADEDLPPGSYLVEALVPGYKLVSERVEIKDKKEIKLKLIPLSSPKPRAVGTNVDVDMGRGSGGATIMPPNL